MLASTLGIRLILLVGPTVPLPAPYDVTQALQSAEVTNDAATGDGFQLTFTLGKEGADYTLLSSGLLDTFNRIIVGVLMGATPEVLIDGIITHHQVTPSNEPGRSTLTITGKDVSVMLDLEEKNEQFPNQTDQIIVTQILGQYAMYGLVPAPAPTTDVPIEIERVPRQHETDLQFVKRLAQKNGFVFYVEPVTFGVNNAYWGPESRASLPQPALTTNMGHYSNVKSLNFANDAYAPVGTQGSFVEPTTKTSIPIPPLPSLKVPPLASSPATPRRTQLMRQTANQNASSAAVSAIAAATNAPDPVTGTGELDAVRYGYVLRARKLVGVRGAGLNYNGLYYVQRVSHRISQGTYTQSFTLRREGTGTLTPVVRPS
ncbi:MAG TPA: contractile injection system protein, VgrG/Pvc8 family [Pyrinomonadaceae bacterium]